MWFDWPNFEHLKLCPYIRMRFSWSTTYHNIRGLSCTNHGTRIALQLLFPKCSVGILVKSHFIFFFYPKYKFIRSHFGCYHSRRLSYYPFFIQFIYDCLTSLFGPPNPISPPHLTTPQWVLGPIILELNWVCLTSTTSPKYISISSQILTSDLKGILLRSLFQSK